MRIGIDGHMLGDRSGGNESYYTNILQNMEIPDGCSMFLFMKEGMDADLYRGRFEIVRFHSKNAAVRNFFELPLLCKKYKLDLLHTQYFIPFWRPCKVVSTVFDICFVHFGDIFGRKERLIQKMLIRYTARHAKAIITCSEYSRQDITEYFHLGGNKVIVAHGAVNPIFRELNDSEVNLADLKERFNTGDDYILTVGNLQPRKNVVRLINAFSNMKDHHGGSEKLVIVGKKAWMYHEIFKAAIGHHQDIVFTDYVSESDLVRLYNGAACFIYPSIFEGFGLPPLEAIACGIPVAVANTSSLPEAVGMAGLYFDPYSEKEMEDAMHTLLYNDAVRRQLIEVGKNQVVKFDWKRSAQIITDVYLRVNPMV